MEEFKINEESKKITSEDTKITENIITERIDFNNYFPNFIEKFNELFFNKKEVISLKTVEPLSQIIKTQLDK